MGPKHVRRRGLCWVVLAFAVCTGLTACFEPVKDTHPNQVLTKRRALFKEFTRTLEPMGLMASGRNDFQQDVFLAQALDLEKLAPKPWVYFPPDGNYPPTHARPAVWSHPQEFKQAQDVFQDAVHQLAQAARSGDQAKAFAAYALVTERCKACHNNFRYN